MPCFFCDIQEQRDSQLITANDFFVARYDDFPVAKGHAEIFPKEHIESVFDLPAEQQWAFFDILNKVKSILAEKYQPDGFNIGINEGRAAGKTMDHLHLHVIPRYWRDIASPRDGVRNIIPTKGDYKKDIQARPDRIKYFNE
jgi:diadenosine tetraphosphate (Ap4A) HIT family hydrolase